MSSVLEFVLRPREKTALAAVNGAAEVIMFPGVRFERIDFDEAIFEPESPNPSGAHDRKHALKS